MKKALQVASVASMIDQFNRNNIKIMQELGYETHVAANFSFGSSCSQEKVNQCQQDLEATNVTVHNLLFDRNIFSLGNFKVYRELKKLIDKEEYELIHCHSPIGAVLTRLAARKARKKGVHVIYTAHGFHFFKGAPLLNWLIYFPIEWICSIWTDTLITINQEDYKFAQKYMKAKEIDYVPGIGVDTEKFKNVEVDIAKKRGELGLSQESILLLSVGELNKNKNHQVIIEALAELNNPDVHYCIAGQGELADYLKDKAKQLGIDKQVHLLGFRRDVAELYKAADIYCFPSYREGLSVALMEAISAGIPVVCSKIRGNVDLVNNQRGITCQPENVQEFYHALKIIIENIDTYKMNNADTTFISEFDKVAVMKRMKQIYVEQNK